MFVSNHNTNLGRCKSGLEATEHPTIKDIIGSAGFYEGEGNASTDSRYPGGTTTVCIGQKDRWVLERHRALFGGSIGEAKHKNYPSTWQWRISGARARGYLMTIYSFLSPRRKEQIKMALGKSN